MEEINQNPEQPKELTNAPLDNPVLYIVLSAIEIILCCPSIPGLIALIFSILANSSEKAGDTVKAESNLKAAKICLVIGAVFFVIALIVQWVTGKLFTEFAQEYMKQTQQ